MSCVLIAFVFAHPILSFTRLEPKPPDLAERRLSCRDSMYKEKVEKHRRQLLDELKRYEAFCEIKERVSDYWLSPIPKRISSHAVDLLVSKPGLIRCRTVPQYFPPDPPFSFQRERVSMLDPTGELRQQKK